MELLLDRFLGYSLCILVFLFIFACRKWFERSKEQKLKALVAWCVTGDYCPAVGRHSYVWELWDAILSAQSSLNVQDKYKIDKESECTFCKDIIEEYQKDIARKYFLDHLSIIKSKYAIDGRDYFMFTLHDYLEEHQCDDEFLGYNMRREQLSCKRYDSGGFLASYALSEFAVAYNKMYYISYLYCKSSKITNPHESPHWNDWEEKSLKEILDTKQIQLSRG